MASAGGKFPKKSRCLLCEGQMRRSSICSLRHIQEHLQYKKYACRECLYRCCTEDASMVHHWKSGHRVALRENEYLEMLSSKIYMDCLHAADFGIEQVLIAMRADSFNRSRIVEQAKNVKTEGGSDDVVEVDVTERNVAGRQAEQAREDEHSERAEVSNKQQEHHLHDSGEMTTSATDIASTVKTIRTEARKNSESAMGGALTELVDPTRTAEMICSASKKKKKRRPSSSEHEIAAEPVSESQQIDVACRSEPAAERLEDNTSLKTDIAKKVSCRKCGKVVASDYVHRRRHVTMHHHKAVADEDFDEILASEIRTCFPGCLVYSDIQCNECGREYKSESGRKYHAIRYHMQRMLKCVIHGCNVQEHSPSALKTHIQNDHRMAISSESNADVFRVFLCAKKKFDAALATEVLRCFPIDLRSRTSNPHMSASAGDDDDQRPRASSAPALASVDSNDTKAAPSVDSTGSVSPVQPRTGSVSATARNGVSVVRSTLGTERKEPRRESRNWDESSSSSSDDSDSRRFAEAMRNRGQSDNAFPQSPADGDSAWPSVASLSKKAPPQASQLQQTPSPSTVADVVGPSTVADVVGPPHPQTVVKTSPPAISSPLSSQSATKPLAQQECYKRRALLSLNEAQRQLMQHSRAAVNLSSIPWHDLTSSDAVDHRAMSNTRRSLLWEGRTIPSLFHPDHTHNFYEPFDMRPPDRSLCENVYANERHDNNPSGTCTFDRLQRAHNRTFPPPSKKRSHQRGCSVRRDRGGLIVRGKSSKREGTRRSLITRNRMAGGGSKRRDALGNSICGSSTGRKSKKKQNESLCSSLTKKSAEKKAAKAVVPRALLADTSDGDTDKGGKRLNASLSRLSKTSSRRWSGKRKRLDSDEFSREREKPVEAKAEHREWYVKEEL